jgi:uncharacterized BrkB/YihY/UPF0761 family membrane protein
MTADQEFERKKVCYEQNFAQARSLNEQMNRVPVLAMTLTGGLWFGAGVTENLLSEIRFALLLFAGIGNIALILAALRIRDALESYFEKIRTFHEESFVSGMPKKPILPLLGSYSMISIYCVLLLTASLLSFIGSFGFYWPASFHAPRWLGVVTLIVLLAGIGMYFKFVKKNKPQEWAKGA